MPRHLRTFATNLALAFIFALFAAAHAQQFAVEPRLSLILLVGMEAALVVFFLIRKAPDQTWHSWQTWLTTGAGTIFPLLLRPLAGADDVLIGQLVQTAGVALQVAAVLSLNKAMGLLPAHRSIKTGGLYRFVRHPLYAAHTVALVGYLLNNLSAYNIAIIVAGTAFQILRIRNEESLLRGYPDYAAFAGRTRWRLVPFVW